MLYDLNSFLLGFGVGIEDLPLPTEVAVDIMDRQHPERYHRQYRIMYAHLVMKALGKYNRDMIDAVKNKHFGFIRS